MPTAPHPFRSCLSLSVPVCLGSFCLAWPLCLVVCLFCGSICCFGVCAVFFVFDFAFFVGRFCDFFGVCELGIRAVVYGWDVLVI